MFRWIVAWLKRRRRSPVPALSVGWQVYAAEFSDGRRGLLFLSPGPSRLFWVAWGRTEGLGRGHDGLNN